MSRLLGNASRSVATPRAVRIGGGDLLPARVQPPGPFPAAEPLSIQEHPWLATSEFETGGNNQSSFSESFVDASRLVRSHDPNIPAAWSPVVRNNCVRPDSNLS